MKKYQDINAKTVDKWVQSGWKWGQAIDHESYHQAKNGNWSVLLTPNIPVPKDWFGKLRDTKLLGLASGGGQQMPIFQAQGANCTVFDISTAQLDNERLVAQRENYEITLVQGDMSQTLPFADDSFDIIFHPVSNCYVLDISVIWQQCHRVLRKGGRLLAGFDNGILYAFDEQGRFDRPLPFNPLEDDALYQDSIDNDAGIQFSHTIQEQIGGQLKAGFRLVDIYQDTNDRPPLADYNIPCFYATLAIKD